MHQVQGSNREQEDVYGWIEKNRTLKEDKDRKWDEIKRNVWQNGSQPK